MRSMKSALYARVSSKDQEESGFSIPAQQRMAADYCIKHGLDLVAEFIDVETAKKSGRTNFGEMLKFLKKNPSVRTIVVEKTDRLYRNFKDYILLEELGLTIHFYKENVILTPESNSHEKFMHGIKVLMAKNYLDNLSEEVKKGMGEKARQGIYPSRAPIGYLNELSKKTLIRDPDRAPIVTRLFELYAAGGQSISALHRYALENGLTYPPPFSGKPISRSTIARILTNPIYSGTFLWKGQRFDSSIERLITPELYERVQAMMQGRSLGVAQARTFAFVGLLRCGHCGCSITAEIKKQKYIYYRCTGFKGKCPEKYMREELLEEKLDALVRVIHVPDQVIDWMQQALKESFREEQQFHQEASQALRQQEERLETRLGKLYEDKLDSVIAEAFWLTKHREYQEELDRIRTKLKAHQVADAKYIDYGVQVLELARTLYPRYSQQNSFEKRKLLDFVLSNCILKDGELTVGYRQPFDILASAADMTKKRDWLDPSDPTSLSIRRGQRDSNPRPNDS